MVGLKHVSHNSDKVSSQGQNYPDPSPDPSPDPDPDPSPDTFPFSIYSK